MIGLGCRQAKNHSIVIGILPLYFLLSYPTVEGVLLLSKP